MLGHVGCPSCDLEHTLYIQKEYSTHTNEHVLTYFYGRNKWHHSLLKLCMVTTSTLPCAMTTSTSRLRRFLSKFRGVVSPTRNDRTLWYTTHTTQQTLTDGTCSQTGWHIMWLVMLNCEYPKSQYSQGEHIPPTVFLLELATYARPSTPFAKSW